MYKQSNVAAAVVLAAAAAVVVVVAVVAVLVVLLVVLLVVVHICVAHLFTMQHCDRTCLTQETQNYIIIA